MNRFLKISLILLILSGCQNQYIPLESVEELVVEGWIEAGHSPVVLVSTTLPVSSTPRELSSIREHILRYAEVYIENNGVKTYLTARLTDKYAVMNYFTSNTLRGKTGETYNLHVKWREYEASATCTIPQTVSVDEAFFEKENSDTTFVVKIRFANNPADGHYYQSFMRTGSGNKAFKAVNFSTLDGSLQDTVITEKFMKTLSSISYLDGSGTSLSDNTSNDVYFHPGDTVAIKLATMEKQIYDFWNSFADAYNSDGSVIGAPKNLKGNVNGAIGYWAGYGISIRDIVISDFY